MSDSLWPHGLQHIRLPCPLLSPRVCSNSCPLSQWCYLTVSSSATLFISYHNKKVSKNKMQIECIHYIKRNIFKCRKRVLFIPQLMTTTNDNYKKFLLTQASERTELCMAIQHQDIFITYNILKRAINLLLLKLDSKAMSKSALVDNHHLIYIIWYEASSQHWEKKNT